MSMCWLASVFYSCMWLHYGWSHISSRIGLSKEKEDDQKAEFELCCHPATPGTFCLSRSLFPCSSHTSTGSPSLPLPPSSLTSSLSFSSYIPSHPLPSTLLPLYLCNFYLLPTVSLFLPFLYLFFFSLSSSSSFSTSIFFSSFYPSPFASL